MAQTQNLVFYHGDDFELIFRLKNKGTGLPIDLTGAEPRADIKTDVHDTTATLSFTAELYDATDGTTRISLTGAEVAELDPDTGYVWDVQLHWPDDTIKTYL